MLNISEAGEVANKVYALAQTVNPEVLEGLCTMTFHPVADGSGVKIELLGVGTMRTSFAHGFIDDCEVPVAFQVEIDSRKGGAA